MKGSRETQQISTSVPTPVTISLLGSTAAGIELGEWPGDTQAEEKVWHIFYDKEKIIGSLLNPFATNVCLQQRTSEHPHDRGDLIAGCSDRNGKEMLPLTVEKAQNYQRQYGNRMNAPLLVRVQFHSTNVIDRSWKTDTVDAHRLLCYL